MLEPYNLYILFDITYNNNIVVILTLFYSIVIHKIEILQHFINVYEIDNIYVKPSTQLLCNLFFSFHNIIVLFLSFKL